VVAGDDEFEFRGDATEHLQTILIVPGATSNGEITAVQDNVYRGRRKLEGNVFDAEFEVVGVGEDEEAGGDSFWCRRHHLIGES